MEVKYHSKYKKSPYTYMFIMLDILKYVFKLLTEWLMSVTS